MKMNDAGSLGVVLEAQIALPVENDDDRDRVWTAIRAIAKMLPNSPIRPGAASKYSPEVQATLDSISNGVRTAARNYFKAGMHNLLRMHGKSGGGLYADADEFGDAEAKKVVNDLKRRMRENIWDGTIPGLETQTFPVAEVNEEEWIVADSTPEAPLADNAIGVPVSRAKAEPYGMFFGFIP